VVPSSGAQDRRVSRPARETMRHTRRARTAGPWGADGINLSPRRRAPTSLASTPLCCPSPAGCGDQRTAVAPTENPEKLETARTTIPGGRSCAPIA